MKTKIVLSSYCISQLNTAAKELKMSRSEVIKTLINHYACKNRKKIKLFRAVQYQKFEPGQKWQRFHLSLTPEQYEHMTDLRNFSKMSISHIISFSILHYLDTIIRNLIRKKRVYLTSINSYYVQTLESQEHIIFLISYHKECQSNNYS